MPNTGFRRRASLKVSPAIHLLLGGPTNLGDTVCKCSGNSKHEAQHNIWDFKPQRLQGVAQPTSQRTSVKLGDFPFIPTSRGAHCPSVSFVGQRAFHADQFPKTELVPAKCRRYCLENLVNRISSNSLANDNRCPDTCGELAFPAPLALEPSAEESWPSVKS